MPTLLNAASRQYVLFAVLQPMTINGQAVNPTGYNASLAFLNTTADPQDSDWNSGIWASTVEYPYCIACLVGPGAVSLTRGTYFVWAQINASPELIVLESPTLLLVA